MISQSCIYDIPNRHHLNKEKYQLVESIDDCFKIVEEILLDQKILGLDCEGIYLSKEGKLTLIQVKII